MAINFISFKDADAEQVIQSKSDNIEIMIKQMKLYNFFSHFFLDIKLDWKHQI